MAVDKIVQMYRRRLGLKTDSRNDAETMRVDNRLEVAQVGMQAHSADLPSG